jgi:hypothetical protein
MPRMDAVEYRISALEAYRALDQEAQKHFLRHYRGGSTVSALQVACLYYAGVQLLLPGQDPGLELGRECGLARGWWGRGECSSGRRTYESKPSAPGANEWAAWCQSW